MREELRELPLAVDPRARSCPESPFGRASSRGSSASASARRDVPSRRRGVRVCSRCGLSCFHDRHRRRLGASRRNRIADSSLKFLLRAFALFLIALPFLAIAAVLMCFQDRPLVTRSVQLTPQDIETAKRVIDAHDPRKAGPGGMHTVAIDERDLDLALNYVASRLGYGAVRVVLRPGAAWLQASFDVPRSPIGRYVNIDAMLEETASLPRVLQLKIGSLPVPAMLGDYLLREAVGAYGRDGPGRARGRRREPRQRRRRTPHRDLPLERRHRRARARRAGRSGRPGTAARLSRPSCRRRDEDAEQASPSPRSCGRCSCSPSTGVPQATSCARTGRPSSCWRSTRTARGSARSCRPQGSGRSRRGAP